MKYYNPIIKDGVSGNYITNMFIPTDSYCIVNEGAMVSFKNKGNIYDPLVESGVIYIPYENLCYIRVVNKDAPKPEQP